MFGVKFERAEEDRLRFEREWNPQSFVAWFSKRRRKMSAGAGSMNLVGRSFDREGGLRSIFPALLRSTLA